MMTQNQIVQFGSAMDSRIGEYFDGFVLIGFIAGTNQPITLTKVGDPKTALAIQTMLASVELEIPTRHHGGA